jgi:hypothetical protein
MLVSVGEELDSRVGLDPLGVFSTDPLGRVLSMAAESRETFGLQGFTRFAEPEVDCSALSEGVSSINCLRFFRRPSGSVYKGEIGSVS